MWKVKLLILCLGLPLSRCEDCDTLGVLFYEDIGCTPVKIEGKPCPVQFKCPDLTIKNGTCLFQSKVLKNGDIADENVTYSTCRTGCFCNEWGTFTCAELDCPAFDPGCYPTFKVGDCCSSGQKCEPFKDLAKCVVDGKEYLEGQQFEPKNTCVECVCQKGFEGKFVEPFCKRKMCSEQIADSKKLALGCAPTYFGGCHLCCPSTYVCPKDSDVFTKISDVQNDSDLKCKFGKHIVKLGEGLETKINHWGHDKNVKCECILPPFLTCTENK